MNGDVVDDLVVSALEECRIDRAEWLVPLDRQSGGKGHRVLLGDPDVEGPLGERFRENIDAGARRHGGRDGDDAFVLGRLLDQALAEDLRIGWRIGLGLGLGAGGDVEFHDAMILVAGGFRGA